MKTIEQLGVSPAPWEVGKRVPFCEDTIIFRGHRVIASCNSVYSEKQARRDARLIAAAPELYEALREIVDDNKCGLMCSLCGAADKCKLRRAVAALEKAGGKA